MMFTFGSMTLLGAACKNFGGMMTGPFFWLLLGGRGWGADVVGLVRVILGAAESAFFPLVGIDWVIQEGKQMLDAKASW